jgi:hypothetical protein
MDHARRVVGNAQHARVIVGNSVVPDPTQLAHLQVRLPKSDDAESDQLVVLAGPILNHEVRPVCEDHSDAVVLCVAIMRVDPDHGDFAVGREQHRRLPVPFPRRLMWDKTTQASVTRTAKPNEGSRVRWRPAPTIVTSSRSTSIPSNFPAQTEMVSPSSASSTASLHGGKGRHPVVAHSPRLRFGAPGSRSTSTRRPAARGRATATRRAVARGRSTPTCRIAQVGRGSRVRPR